MAPARNRKLTQHEVIIESWEKLEAESVGRRELLAIGDVLRDRFGTAAPSPAAIARTLADHGVPLSHAEVLETDSAWREPQLQIVAGELETIEAAFVAIDTIRSAMSSVPANRIDQLRLQIRQVQEELKLLAKSKIGSARRNAVAGELAAWLTVWLQNPAVFDDWLALRRNSPEFLQKFG